jgi:hypothetical protein
VTQNLLKYIERDQKDRHDRSSVENTATLLGAINSGYQQLACNPDVNTTALGQLSNSFGEIMKMALNKKSSPTSK